MKVVFLLTTLDHIDTEVVGVYTTRAAAEQRARQHPDGTQIEARMVDELCSDPEALKKYHVNISRDGHITHISGGGPIKDCWSEPVGYVSDVFTYADLRGYYRHLVVAAVDRVGARKIANQRRMDLIETGGWPIS